MEDIRGIQRKLLDPDHLAAEEFPEILLETVAVQPETGDRLLARARITLRGVTQELDLPVKLERSGRGLVLSGSLRIRQRDFGIEPESIGGVVKVSNDVDLHFVLSAVATSNVCSTPGSGANASIRRGP